jgi:hypothetical protein
MYAQVKKPKENMSEAVATSVTNTNRTSGQVGSKINIRDMRTQSFLKKAGDRKEVFQLVTGATTNTKIGTKDIEAHHTYFPENNLNNNLHITVLYTKDGTTYSIRSYYTTTSRVNGYWSEWSVEGGIKAAAANARIPLQLIVDGLNTNADVNQLKQNAIDIYKLDAQIEDKYKQYDAGQVINGIHTGFM